MIKIDTEIPQTCAECEFTYISAGALEFKCILNHKSHDVSFEWRDKTRPEWCPLKDEVAKIIK